MVVGELAESVDLVVVGGGPGGYTAALEAAASGRSVVLVDRDGVDGIGGVCLRVGCIPSKALIELADVVHRAQEFRQAGALLELAGIDLALFQGWKGELVGRLSRGVQGLLKSAGVEVVQGSFRFLGAQRGIVDAGAGEIPRYLEFTDAILATGSQPIDLPGLPRDGDRVLSSADVLALTELPASVVIAGGGYIGLELGTALRKLGSAVTIVEMAGTLLPGVEAALVAPVARRLSSLGVGVRLGARVTGYVDGQVEIESEGERVQLAADKLIVAIGRRPNTTDLGLERLGVTPRADGLLDVGPDRRLTDHVAAIGDITPGPALAHKATAEAVVAAAALCGKPAAFDPAVVPIVIFGDPEIAYAGMPDAGADLHITRLPFGAVGRAATLNDTAGFIQLAVDRVTQAVTSVGIVGKHASELIAEGVLAIEMAAMLADLHGSIHPHPTLSESFADAARQMRAAAPTPTAGIRDRRENRRIDSSLHDPMEEPV